MAVKYLYGAAVQGIQSFIFQTNELKDIVGASELVEEICTATCNELIEGKSEILTRAAGKIRCVFSSENDCKELVKIFPKIISEKAPGVTLSQAVVKYNSDSEYSKKSQELEDALRVQRNIPMNSINIGLMGIKRSPRTGQPVLFGTNGLDKATFKKKEACNDARLKLMKDLYSKVDEKKRPKSANISKLTGLNDWIAMVHIDGNGLGQVFEGMGYDPHKCKEFSIALDKATKIAASEAIAELAIAFSDDFYKVPVLPVVLSGDDFTFICRASIAVDFVQMYMNKFEKETEKIGHKLTSCAGIAFMKSSYPYYYAYDLAETLCGEAKTKSNRKASCLMFHKIQDSFVESYSDIEKRELTLSEGLSFKYGPYYVDGTLTDKPSIKDLIDDVELLDKEESGAIKSHIRQWMSELHKDKGRAVQKARRVSSLLPKDSKAKKLFDKVTMWEKKEAKVFPAYDLLSLASVKFQDTKSKED